MTVFPLIIYIPYYAKDFPYGMTNWISGHPANDGHRGVELYRRVGMEEGRGRPSVVLCPTIYYICSWFHGDGGTLSLRAICPKYFAQPAYIHSIEGRITGHRHSGTVIPIPSKSVTEQ